jgi:hypothetical protein
MLEITYRCPDCGHTWNEVYESACDSECPECGAGEITALSWVELTPEQAAEAERPKKWLVTRTVLESLFIEARNERAAIEAAIGQETGWMRSIDREDYDCTPPPAGGYILGLPIV